MKTLVVYLRNDAADRIDRVTVSEGSTLRDTDDGKKDRPFISISAITRIELVDDATAPSSVFGLREGSE